MFDENWNPLVVTDGFPCDSNEADFYKDIEGAREEDLVGKECGHKDNDRGDPGDNPHCMCEGHYELLTDGSCNEHYGPRECKRCHDTSRQCMRVKCSNCGDITHRYRWYVQQLFTMKVENPRKIACWYPLG